MLAELSGPELPQALPLETVPGGTFLLPGFQQEGDYYLENIRLLNDATGEVLSFAAPAVAILHVRQIVLTSASVRTLTLEELRARGISPTAENFQAYDFAVGFAIADQVVEIRFPILYTGDGEAVALAKPEVQLDGLPPDVVATGRALEAAADRALQARGEARGGRARDRRGGGRGAGPAGFRRHRDPRDRHLPQPVLRRQPDRRQRRRRRLRRAAREPARRLRLPAGQPCLRMAETVPAVGPGQGRAGARPPAAAACSSRRSRARRAGPSKACGRAPTPW